LRLLASREHSRFELARKLRARGFAEGEVESALTDLVRDGSVSDARMAEAYAAERLAKGFGPLRVRQELRQRGIADFLIDPHLDRSSGEWMRHLAAVHDKKFGNTVPSDAKELGRRARFLEYRGFPPQLIGRFLHGENEL